MFVGLEVQDCCTESSVSKFYGKIIYKLNGLALGFKKLKDDSDTFSVSFILYIMCIYAVYI